MHNIQIYHQEKTYGYILSGKLEALGFFFEEKKDKIKVSRHKKSQHFSHSLCWEDYSIYSHEFLDYQAYILPDNFVFGRTCVSSGECELVSLEHFRIFQGKLKDLDSKNGTYLNGKKTDTAKLQLFDEIVAGQVRMYWCGMILISSLPLRLETAAELPVQFKEYMEGSHQIHQPSPFKTFLENAQIPAIPAKARLFQTIGSSLMIVLSVSVMAVISYLINPNRLESVMTMMATSMSMAFAFLAYALINQRMDKKEHQLQYDKACAQYDAYLQRSQKQIMEAHDLEQKKVQEEIHLWSSLSECLYGVFDSEAFKLPIGLYTNNWLEAETGKTSYREEEIFWNQKRRKVLEQVPYTVESLAYLEEGKKIWLKQNLDLIQIQSLLERWIFSSHPPLQSLLLIDDDFSSPLKYHPYIKQVSCAQLEQKHIESAMWILCRDKEGLSKLRGCDKPLLYTGTYKAGLCWDHEIEKMLEFQPAPEKIRFLMSAQRKENPWNKLYACTNLEDLEIEQVRSQQADLKIGLGIDEKGDVVYLDLNEEADGPHVLVAGTTGSGKSEFLNSVLLQLCFQNNARLLQFIIIDFKGSALGASFYGFDHCAGSVSNLDLYDMHRFIAAMEAEVALRQKKLAGLLKKKENMRAHIDDWNASYPNEPMAHLFIVIDEFAQLKSRMPETMNYMKELARIGRSLGFHLILATQKPAGIVDEQIWSNSRSRICLKVNSVQDSREILGHEKASGLRLCGELILQVGQKEKEVSARSFYTRQPLPGRSSKAMRLNENYDLFNPLLEEPKQSVFSLLSGKIMSCRQDIPDLLPDFSAAKPEKMETFLILDLPGQHRLAPYQFEARMPLFILLENEDGICPVLSALKAAHENLDMYVLSSQKLAKIEPLNGPQSYWKAALISQKSLVVYIKERKEDSFWIEQLAKNEHIHLVVLMMQQDGYAVLKGRKMAQASCKKECIRSFFSYYGMMDYEFKEDYYFMHENQLIRARMAASRQEPKLSMLKRKDSRLFIGCDMQQSLPYFLEEGKGLIIAYSSACMRTKAYDLVMSWKRRSPFLSFSALSEGGQVKIVDLVEAGFNIDAPLKEALAMHDLLWLGDGFNDWAIRLGLRSVFEPYQAGLLIENGTCHLLAQIGD